MHSIPLADDLSPPEAAALFETHGALQFSTVASADWLAMARTAVHKALDDRLTAAHAHGGLGIEKDEGYAEIVQRSAGRYDIVFAETSPLHSTAALAGRPRILETLRCLLGPEVRLALSGAVVAHPGAAEQPWHADGAALFPEVDAHLPPHCINVFVPLEDLPLERGPTEFCLGTHTQTRRLPLPYDPSPTYRAVLGHTDAPIPGVASAGAAILFDYRLLHRALANRSDQVRPVFYLTFARQWFRDRTFPSRSLTLT